jgi:hypothetical protein
MRYHVLAADYDETLAEHGRVAEDTVPALERLRATGRHLVLVTGRELADLMSVFGRLDLFHRVVAENGAVVHDPATRSTRVLCEAPPDPFMQALRARGVPIGVGKAIVATVRPHEKTVLEVIAALGLELQVVFNRSAVMVLPSGTNKATGLRAALDEMGFSLHNVVGIGDAENDHAFLSACECAVAVSNAVPALRRRADHVTTNPAGAGVRELVAALLENDLAALGGCGDRHALRLGTGPFGPVTIPAHGASILIAGTSGSGKSTLAKALLEQLTDQGYQFCVIDPEGDHSLEGAVVLGGRTQPPSMAELVDLLARPAPSVVVNLLGVPIADRPRAFEELLGHVLPIRNRKGRPHYLVVDEAHHMMPEGWKEHPGVSPDPGGLLFITVHPEHVSPHALGTVSSLLVVGDTPRATLRGFVGRLGIGLPPAPEGALERGRALFWSVPGGAAPTMIQASEPRVEHRRHVRKYALGELGPDKSFYFRGADGRLNLRARNLEAFLQIAEGIDDATWLFHLRRGDYSCWLRTAIKDEELAARVSEIEQDPAGTAPRSRELVRLSIVERYTAPE